MLKNLCVTEKKLNIVTMLPCIITAEYWIWFHILDFHHRDIIFFCCTSKQSAKVRIFQAGNYDKYFVVYFYIIV